MGEVTTAITLKIADKEFRLRVKDDDEPAYRSAQKLAQQIFDKYKEKFKLDDSDLMAMTIIDIAKKYIDLYNQKENVEIFTEMSDIVESLGEYLKEQ